MFILNKYHTWYYNIINRAKSRELPVTFYTEKHHIVPKSFFKEYDAKHGWIDGNANSTENIIKLTAKEHYICHLLLTKMTEGIAKTKMLHAAWRMCLKRNTGKNKRDYKISSRTYEALRKERSKILSENAGPYHYNTGRKTGRTRDDFTIEWKNNISKSKKGVTAGKNNPMYGKNHTQESKDKMSLTRRQKAGLTGWNVRPPCTAEKAKKIKEANTGKKWIHNKETSERKYINPSDVAYYLNIGWNLGLGPRN